MRVSKKTVEGTTRYTVFDDEGKRVETYASEDEAYLAIGLCSKGVEDYPGSWRTHPCKRPIKTEGATLCNMHLGHVKRAAKKREEEHNVEVARREASSLARTRGREVLARVQGVLGGAVSEWAVKPSFSRNSYHAQPGTFEVRYETLIALIEAAERGGE